jgi:Sulfotransferase family
LTAFPATDAPIFVLCSARSGSTLLRLLLDSHPEIACPPETNLAAIFSGLNGLLPITLGDDVATREVEAAALCRDVADRTLGAYARRTGKRRWADKSLVTAAGADLVLDVFPTAQFICLFRGCADTIFSLLEASPYGLQAYGLPAYASRFPSNSVMACAALWLDTATRILEFERNHSAQCYRLRYEDLVRAPTDVLTSLCAFLGVEATGTAPMFDELLAPEKRANGGAGDYKIWYTDRIDDRSIGRGDAIPIGFIPEPMQQRINETLGELGYQPLGRTASSGRQRMLRRTLLDGREAILRRRDDGVPVVSINNDPLDPGVRELLRGRVVRRLQELQRPLPEINVVGLELTDTADAWLIDFGRRETRRGREEVTWSVRTDHRTLLDMAEGKVNAGVAIRHGAVSLANPTLMRRAGWRRQQMAWRKEEGVDGTAVLNAVIDLIVPGAVSALGGHPDAVAVTTVPLEQAESRAAMMTEDIPTPAEASGFAFEQPEAAED